MIDPAVLPVFVPVILLFLVPPGPDMAFVVAAGLEGGRRAAAWAIAGVGTGLGVYAAVAVAGVGELARSFPVLLDVVKVVGALYLLRLAVVTVRTARTTAARAASTPTARPYRRGAVVSLTNPKVILFFVAVLPQFIGDARAPLLQLALLGAITVLTEVLLYGALGVLAGGLHTRFSTSPTADSVLHRIAAAVYVVLAVVVLAEVIARSVDVLTG